MNSLWKTYVHVETCKQLIPADSKRIMLLCIQDIMQLSIFAINIPLCTPGDLHQTFVPTLGRLRPSFCLRARNFWGQLPRGGHLSVNDVCHFWSFHYNGKNWRLTTLWGLLVALKFYTFLRKLFSLRLNQS